MNILSIQSAVTHGHVGNSAAVFPLQRLGAEVWPIDTVQFSNHPGHGSHTGAATPPELIRALVDGIEAQGALASCDAMLSGYIGDPGTGAALLHAAARLRACNPAALWCCDPVIGDDAPGVYVRPGVEAFLRDRAVPQADLLTPNQFELARLTGRPCATFAEALAAAGTLQGAMRQDGRRVVLVTSLRTDGTPDDALDLLCAAAGLAHRLRLPRLPMAPSGAGDTMAALFLFHVLRTGDAAQAMAVAASATFGLLRRTLQAGSAELLTVQAQDEYISPTRRFVAEAC